MDPVAVRSDRLRLDDEISASHARCFHCWSSLVLAPAEGLWTVSRATERERSAPKLKSNRQHWNQQTLREKRRTGVKQSDAAARG